MRNSFSISLNLLKNYSKILKIDLNSFCLGLDGAFNLEMASERLPSISSHCIVPVHHWYHWPATLVEGVYLHIVFGVEVSF
jgi:hypothetical protein